MTLTAAGEPALHVSRPRGSVRGIAVVLHGGREASEAPVRPAQLPVLRMLPFAAGLRRAGADAGLAVARVRYLVRGWNGADRAPVRDARWALDRLTERFPDVPVALVGHSMGGRTAVHVADHPGVTTVVGLAPWIEFGDPVTPMTGKRVLIAHGDADRITSPRASAAYARAAAPLARSLSFVTVRGDKHAMLHRAGVWHALSTGFVLGALFGTPPPGTLPPSLANVLDGALAGRPELVV